MTLFRHVALSAQKALNAGALLGRIERAVLRDEPTVAPPPVLLLGPPRAGTTLAFELLVTGFEVAYPTNVASLLYTAPVFATWLLRKLHVTHRPRFVSDLGYVGGLAAPSEAGPLCRYWFGDATHPARLAPDDVRRRHAALCRLQGGPLIFKNLYLVDNLAGVAAVFGEFFVVRVRREPVAVAASILETRMRLFGNESAWWGPGRASSGRSAAARDPVEEIAAQIARIESALDRLLAEPARQGWSVSCSYEDICASPVAFRARVAEAYGRVTGIALRCPPATHVPVATAPREKSLEHGLRERIERAIAVPHQD